MEISINNFNLGLFKQMINESLNTHSHLMLEINNEFIKSLSISTSNTLLKIGYAKFENFCNDVKPDNFKIFNMYVLEGGNFKKYLDLYSELENTDIKFTLKVDTNSTDVEKLIATKIELTGETSKYKTKLSTIFTLTSSELMITTIDDYSSVIEKLKYDSNNTSEFLLKKSNYDELNNLVKNLHSTISTNHNYLEFKVSKNGINVKDKVFDINFNEHNIINSHEDISFKIFKSDFKILGKHNWKIGTTNDNKKLIMLTKIKQIEKDKAEQEIIFGCVLTKTNDAVVVSNDAEDYLDDADDSFGLDLSDYENI